MTQTISPTFDPSDNTWFTEEGHEAKSLAELQEMLPDVVIECYYPSGYGNVIKPRNPEITAKAQEAAAEIFSEPVVDGVVVGASFRDVKSNSTSSYTEKRRREAGLFPRINWTNEGVKNKLKSLVEKGWTSSRISIEMKCSQNAVIGACNRFGFQLQYGKK